MTSSPSSSAPWPSRIATRVEATAARLEVCAVDDFETTLMAVLAEVAGLFGIVAMGEHTADPAVGVTWFDPQATDEAELLSMVPRLETGLGAGGPYSIMAPSGRPGLAIPNPPGSFSHHLAVLAGDGAGFTVDDTSILGLFGAAVSAARRRVEATRELRLQLDTQQFLNSISAMAAIDSPDALRRLLETIAAHFGVGSATVWAYDGVDLVLTESSLDGADRQVDERPRVPTDPEALAALVEIGHVRQTVGDHAAEPPPPFPAETATLAVPLVGPDGPEGVLGFVDAEARVDPEMAYSIARSVQKLLARRRARDESEHRQATEQFLRESASALAEASHHDELDVLDRILTGAITHFELTGASVWSLSDDLTTYWRRRGRWADGSTINGTGTVPAAAFSTGEFQQSGTAVLKHRHLAPIDGELSTPGDSMLVVSLGGPGRVDQILVLMGAHDRHWNDTTITTCRTLGLVIDQGLARFAAEHAVERRLELAGLTHRVAGMAVEARTDTVTGLLDAIMRECAAFFDLAEAQVWRLEDDVATLRTSVRANGAPAPVGLSVPFPATGVMDTRGWAVMRLGDVGDLYTGPILDPVSTRLLVTSYAAGSTTNLGFVVFVDPTARRWTDDEINAVRAVADTIGQLRSRMIVARALERQQSTERLLNEAASSFLDTSLAAVRPAVDDVLEAMRANLGCHSLAIFELDPVTLQITCPGEATDDGEPLQAQYAPLHRDDPVIARILDPDHGPEWRLADLIGLPDGLDRTTMLVFPTVRGRDILILSAVNRFGEPFPAGSASGLRSLSGMLAQLRSRVLLEQTSDLHAATDRLLGAIAADFVERSVDDVAEGIHLALGRIGSLFGLATVSLYASDGAGGLRADSAWEHDPDTERSPRRAVGLAADHPLIERFRSQGPGGFMVEPGADAPEPELATVACAFAPILDGDEVLGAVAATDERPLHLIPNVDILTDFMDAVAQLVRQLWRRLDADRAIGRKLASEDLLRQFATRLAAAPTSDTDSPADAFAWLIGQCGLAHGSLWRSHSDEHLSTAELHLQAGSDPAMVIDPDVSSTLPLVHERAMADEIEPTGVESASDDDALLADLARSVLPLEEPHRVLWLGDADGWRLLVVRTGGESFPAHLIATMATALSVLSQHEARATAERALATAFSSAPIAICLRDRHTNLLSCNQAYVELTGRTEDDLVGSALESVISPEHLHEAIRDLESLGLGEQTARELAYRRPDGGVVWARVRTTPVKVPGRPDPVYFMYSEDITDSRRSRQLLEYQATHDELTGLPNRRSFVGSVSAELAHGLDFAVLILDLDRFKLVNDSYGHSAGDQLLVTCADRIRLSLRPGDLVCRLGGDEFAILLRAPADAAAAAVVSDRLLRLLSEPIRVGDEEVFPSASIGIAIPSDQDGVDELMRHADAAMYQAKGQGRDRWVRFDHSMRDAVLERVRTETELRRAMENDQLEVYYQPEYLLDGGVIVGAEALVRWHHPERGLLPAGAFMPLAEETGIVIDVGRWVLGEATRQAAAWRREGHDIVMRVNLSARQLRTAIVEEVQEALDAAGLAPERLCLELTETAIMDDVRESARILHRFRDLGVAVAIDDFGTGFSSLAYLKRFPVDILKIDRTFVDGVGVDPDDTAIVRSIIGLARTLRLEVVAEGIEDAIQLTELVRLGCTRGQGYHLARPAPPDDIVELLTAPQREPAKRRNGGLA